MSNGLDSKDVRVIVLKTHPSEKSILIDVAVNGKEIEAVVDTAAEVTVVSKKFAESLHPNLSLGKEFILKGAAKGQNFQSQLARVDITIGSVKVPWNIYIAPINDAVILGLDLLRHLRAEVNLHLNTVTVNNRIISSRSARDGEQQEAYRVSRVLVAKRTVVPPGTMAHVRCKLENTMDDDFLVSSSKQVAKPVMVPNTLCRTDNKGVFIMRVLNDTPFYKTVKKDSVLGGASEFVEVVDEEEFQEPWMKSGPIDFGIFEVNTEDPVVRQTTVEKQVMPDYLKDMFQKSCKNLKESEAERFGALLTEYADVFSKGDEDLGHFKDLKFTIDTGDARPVQQRIRRTPLGFEQEEEKHLKSMLSSKIIQPSTSEWASAPVLVRKKDGGMRWCIDYRELNARTVSDQYRMPLISECIDTLSGFEYLSCLDLAAGYWQCEIDEKDRHKTAFITKYGLYEHIRMGFGLKNAPAFFQRVMNLVFRGLTWKEIFSYLDDIMVVGRNFDHHLRNLRKVFERLRQYNLKLKPKKCVFFQTEVKFLGKIVSKDGVKPNPDSVAVVKNWPKPTCTKDVERFLGFVNYHRDFVKDFAELAEALYKLTGKNKFHWGEEQQASFELLKEAMTTTPVLAYPDPEGTFILDCDASDKCVGGELSQVQDGVERPIGFASFALTPLQRKYCTTRKELLALIRLTRHFRHYLLGRRFLARTDHGSLTWLTRFKTLDGQLARWLEELSQYDLEISHRKGCLHVNADALSRIPEDLACSCYRPGVPLKNLPCGGCPYCQRVQRNWGDFEEDVDDVVPLTNRTVRRVTATDVWIPQHSTDELIQAQKDDPDLQPILKWLQDGEPSEAEYFISSAATKHYWVSKSLLRIQDGLLQYLWHGELGVKPLLVVPRVLKAEVLSLCHDKILSGHMGQAKTIWRLHQNFYWYRMVQEAKLYVRNCSVCGYNKKPNRKAKAAQKSYHSGVVMERVHIDILGPFKPSAKGNVYILMMVDQFTKWLECVPLPDQTAESVARGAVEDFFSRFGCPTYLHSDQGKNFDGNVFREVCLLLQITKQRTTAYRASANGQVERYNRTLVQLMRCYIRESQLSWDDNLNLLAGAIRASVNRSTGQTANMMMLGREVRHPQDLMFGSAQRDRETTEPNVYVSKLLKTFTAVHDLARSHLKTAQVRQKSDYDRNLHTTHYEVGDLVMKRDSATSIHWNKKLRPVFRGPYLVVEVLSPLLYKIRDRKRFSVVHHDRLVICSSANIPIWMRRLRDKVLFSGNVDFGDEIDDFCLDRLFEIRESLETSAPTPQESPVLEQTPPIVQTRRGRRVTVPAHLVNYVQ